VEAAYGQLPSIAGPIWKVCTQICSWKPEALPLFTVEVENPDLLIPETRACHGDAAAVRRKGGETIADLAAVQLLLETRRGSACGR
jgi:hypothetical protein